MAALDGSFAAPLVGSFAAPLVAPAATDSPDAFIERLYAHGAEYLTDPYSTIGDAPRFHTKIAGVSFEGRQDIIAGLRADAALELRREPDNPHDPNAIAVHYGNLQLGFFNKKLAAHLAPLIDAGARYRARVASLTGGPAVAFGAPAKHRGVNIFVERDAVARIAPGAGTAREKTPGPAMASDELAEAVRAALIGTAQPHEAQRAVLERIDAGKNTLGGARHGTRQIVLLPICRGAARVFRQREDAGRIPAARAGQRSVRSAAA